MTVAYVQGVNGIQTSSSGTSVSSASITPTNGNFLLVFINMRVNQSGVDPSVSGGGLTYTPLQEASGEGNGWLYIAEVTGSPGAMTVSATYSTGSRAVVLVLEYSGTSGQGASAVSATSTINLDTTANDSMLVVFRSRGSETTPGAPTSHTLREWRSTGGTSAGRVTADSSELAVATAGATSTSWSATTFFDLIAVELLEDGGGAVALTVQDASQAQSADNVALVQRHVLAVNDASHAQSADNVALTQHHVLAVDDASHAQTADNVVLEVAGQLTVQDATQAQSADNVALTQHHVLVVQDASHAQTADSVVLVVALIVADATQAQTADNVALVQRHVLAVQDALQAQSADSVALTQHHVLAVNDASHAQAADNLTLDADNVTELTVQDASQAQSADSVALVQHHVLTVQDALQAQTADNINFTAAIIIATSRGMYLGMFKGMR